MNDFDGIRNFSPEKQYRDVRFIHVEYFITEIDVGSADSLSLLYPQEKPPQYWLVFGLPWSTAALLIRRLDATVDLFKRFCRNITEFTGLDM